MVEEKQENTSSSTKDTEDRQDKKHSVAAFVILVIFALVIGIGIWWYLTIYVQGSSYKSLLKWNKKTTTSKEETTTETNSETKDIETKVNQFEETHKDRDAVKVLNFFTEPILDNDKEFYDFLMGKDIPNGSPRLFATATYSYELKSFSVDKIEKSGDEYRVVVNEKRSVYSNIDGQYSDVSGNRILIMRKIGNDWIVDKYHREGQEETSTESIKYDGFYSNN